MKLYSIPLIVGSLLLIQQLAYSETEIKKSISGEIFFTMFADKTEEEMRADTIMKMNQFAEKYQETKLADIASSFIEKQSAMNANHEWIKETFDFVAKGFKMNPPKSSKWNIRRDLFLILDNPLHVETGDDYHNALIDFYRPLLKDIVDEIKNTEIDEGIRIWRIYNMGFVVKTKNHIVAFDIFNRIDNPEYEWMTFLTKEQTMELAKIVDTAFVSHWHGDHASMEFLEAVAKEGKHAYVPEDPVNYADAKENLVPIRETKTSSPVTYKGIKINSYPGYQGDIPCNVYVLEVDGYVISQNGDNCTHDIYKNIRANHDVDIALANCWSGTNEYVSSIIPKIYITGHENELMHGISHRISYKNTFGNIDKYGLTYPWKKNQPRPMILNSGESMFWKK